MKLTTPILIATLLLAGCATSSKLAEIDAKYDRILAEDCGGDRGRCYHQEKNRILDKEYANSPLKRLENYLAPEGGTGGSGGPNFVIIMNPK